MKRQHPLLTSLGWVLTVILFAGLALSIWSTGGKAFSPGSLSDKHKPGITKEGFGSHAEFETQCSLCHAPLEVTQDELCKVCHENVAAEISDKTGTHSQVENVNRCASCHPDHRGREFDVTGSAYPHFVHSQAGFSLTLHQVDFDASLIECQDCHAVETDFKVSNTSCANCHAIHDSIFMRQHSQEFGQNCLACHDGEDRMTKLDHQLTRFPLTGLHLEVRCVECHKMNAAEPGISLTNTESGSPLAEMDPFKGTPTDCSLCHVEPEIHQGLFEGSCDQCHSTAGWTPALLEGKQFEHMASTGFSLVKHSVDYSDRQMVCMDCHGSDLATVDLQVCITCHSSPDEGIAFMTEHLAQFGGNCLQCHDGADRMSNFDHTLFFPLDGRHLEAECSQCHQEQVFAGTPSECVQCHGEPAIHKGFFGVKCQYCHTAQAWTPAQLRMHTFPLDHGGQGEIACQTCHPNTYPEMTCFGCHDHQPEPIKESHLQAGIPEDEIMLCEKCHPIGIVEANQ